jgi:hypothetical protein
MTKIQAAGKTNTKTLRGMARHLALLACLAAAARAARADFAFLSQTAVFDPATQQVNFTIDFNQAPDFMTVDQYGRQADSFQYYIVGDPSRPYPENYDSIVRGEELHLTGSELRIRNAAPPVSDPAAGGWGSVRGEVPINIDGDVLTFSAPLGVLSDHSTNGEFTYTLETYQYGALTDDVTAQTSVTPEPGSWVLLGTGLLALLLCSPSCRGLIRRGRREGEPAQASTGLSGCEA